MTKCEAKKVVKKTVSTVGKAGRAFVGGALIVTHIALSAVGALLCAITKE